MDFGIIKFLFIHFFFLILYLLQAYFKMCWDLKWAKIRYPGVFKVVEPEFFY